MSLKGMKSQGSERRLSVLAGHFTRHVHLTGSQTGTNCLAQECAAHNIVFYARPEAPRDILYAKPRIEGPVASDLEALACTSQTLRLLASQRSPQPPSSPHFHSKEQQPGACAADHPPRYARPETHAPRQHQQHSLTSTTPRLLSTPSQPANPAIPSAPTSLSPRTNGLIHLSENDFGYVVEIPVPGMKPEDVTIELLPGRRLMITGTRRQKHGVSPLPGLYAALPEVFGLPGGSGTQQRVASQERFNVSWCLPQDANVESVRADVKDGLLRIKLSKNSVLTLL